MLRRSERKPNGIEVNQEGISDSTVTSREATTDRQENLIVDEEVMI